MAGSNDWKPTMPCNLLSKPFGGPHHRRMLLLLAVLAVSLMVVACGDSDDAPPERLSFSYMAGFRAQANLPFVAVYVAEREGFFDEVGLDVDIQHAALGTSEHIQLIAAGEIDLTTQPASEVLQRRAGAGLLDT